MKRMITFMLISCLVMSLNTYAFAADNSSRGPSAGAAVADILVLRPLGFCGTVLGAAAFVISLPITVPTRKTAEVSRILVDQPYSYTFERPLGRM